MQENILPKLEASRKELLDLGMRNTLLNYKVPKARGLHIVQEKSTAIYDILIKQNKAMTFLGRPDKDGDDEDLELPVLSVEELQDSYNDTRLQTNETEPKLQVKILNTYYFAKTSIEEQGVNILYLALGMLNWFEAGNTEEARLAPLVLIPVSLERSSATERFRLRFTGGEVGANLSLQAKMMADFNITIPDLADDEDDFNIESYLQDIAGRIKHHTSWKVDIDAMELGFFSFGKFMIYHDLDSSKWPEDNKPFNHPILLSLFGEGFNEPLPTATEEHNLDKETKAHELFHVVDADSSQVLAMLAVHEGRNMVIQGPPGTGKSQTITNIIANAVGQGKKVLFVAEKMAALDVVKRRLDSINLGEACLELHSHKANKRDLHTELRRVLELGKPTLTHLQDEISLLDGYRGVLNGYCNSINKPIAQSGLSGQKVIGYLLQIAERYKDKLPNVPIVDIESWDADKMRRASSIADLIEIRLKEIGMPTALLFYGTGLTLFLPHEKEETELILQHAVDSTVVLDKMTNDAATFLGTTHVSTRQDAEYLLASLQLTAESPDLSDIAVKDNTWLLNYQDIKDLLETGEQLADLQLLYYDIFLPEAWNQNVLEIRQNLIEHGEKWYKFLLGDYKRSVKQLASFSRVKLPEDITGKIKYVDDILVARRLSVALEENDGLAARLFGNRWRKLKSNWKALEEVLDFQVKVHRAVTEGRYPVAILDFLRKNENPALSKDYVLQLNNCLTQQITAVEKVMKKLDLDVNADETQAIFYLSAFADLIAQLLLRKERLIEIQDAISWNNLAETVTKDGFETLINVALNWQDAAKHLKVSLQKTWYEYLIKQAMTERPPLRVFERTSHEETIEKFKKLDVLNLQYNRARVALKHFEALPKEQGGGQWNILRGEFNRKSRHMPIRKLMQEAGLAIQTIKPVFMMSPMSIANFLPPGSIEFDLVIFDEASQVRPVEALGALLRGKQLVVVGDTKQLPPTSFFDKMNAETEDEENVTADIQSILGMCDGQGAPQRMLRWHYRSRHESLISLSNHEFYENKLIIFPSPGSKQRMGLAFHHLPDAVYDRGHTRTNPIEAETVANAVIEHALKNPKQTLGVVAFSTAQMQAIQNALEIKRRKNPETESFFRNHPHEPFFVKNLENVQGDERDVIFISIGYGRIEGGVVPMSFGPLNNEGGERRLNVLITRAKYRCEIFTNITSDDIKPTANTKFGIRALKSFLYFAQNGIFDAEQDSLTIIERPFEDLVAEQLTDKGFTIRKKIGSEAFYIDMAVVDPAHPGRYLLGIECDGESYSKAKSARDRDRLRKQVLENIGWKIYKVWSTEWYRNPDRELQRLIDAIEKAKEQTSMDDQVEEDLDDEMVSVIREEREIVPVLLPVYEQAVLPAEVAAQELHLVSFGKLAGWINQVVAVEGPVHFDEMARRLADAAGVSKVGSRIKYTITAATEYAIGQKLLTKKNDFLWLPSMENPVIRDRSKLVASAKKLAYISPEEMSLAIKKVVENSIAIQEELALPLIAKMFGFSRVTEEMRKEISAHVELNINQGIIEREALFLKIVQS